MERLLEFSPESGHPSKGPNIHQSNQTNITINQVVIEATFQKAPKDDKVNVHFDDLFKGLSITARKILDKLNEILKADLPEGIQSLKPENHTPEKTADRIVAGATGLFGIFERQNPNLEGEELLTQFMDTIRSGIDKGYEEAFNILEGLGAFEFDGVKAGVEETKVLIEEKLQAFENQKREELGLPVDTTKSQSAETTTDELLTQVGVQTLNIAA